MANRLPIYSRQFITLNKVEVVQSQDNRGQQYDINNQPLPPKFFSTPWYIDSTLILGVREYFDSNTERFYDYRVITFTAGEAIVEESLSSIQNIIDDIDCFDLCPEDPTTPPA